MNESVRIYEPTEEQVAIWKEWVATRPDTVRAIAERIDPWSLYRMEPTSQYVTLYSISEDGTVTVNVPCQYNEMMFFDLQVFGINPDDLKACDAIPKSDLIFGAAS